MAKIRKEISNKLSIFLKDVDTILTCADLTEEQLHFLRKGNNINSIMTDYFKNKGILK